MQSNIGLNELVPGERGIVTQIDTTGSMRRRLLDIGLIPQTMVECVGQSAFGDPAAYLIRGAVIAIRAGDGRKIRITRLKEGT